VLVSCKMNDERPQHAPPLVRTTPWAYASLICSLGVFCPLMTVLGPLLGIKALAEIRSRPGTTGTGLAVAGIIIGLIVTLGWGSAMFWWDRNVRRPILHGPIETLAAGLQGDVAAFKSDFVGPGAEVDDAVAIEFLSEVAARYGMVVNIVQDDSRDPPQTEWGAISPILPYLMHFEGAFVSGEAEFVVLDERRAGIIAKWRWIIFAILSLAISSIRRKHARCVSETLEEITLEQPEEPTDAVEERSD
jgi:hypothetical protein